MASEKVERDGDGKYSTVLSAVQFVGLLAALLYLNVSGVNMVLVLQAAALYLGITVGTLGVLLGLNWTGVLGGE